MTLQDLMRSGDELFSEHILAAQPDWQALLDSTPDDTEPGEEGFSEPTEAAANAQAPADSMQALRTALAADMQPLGDALLAAYQAGDHAATLAALKKISKDMPALAGDASHLAQALAAQSAAAWLGR